MCLTFSVSPTFGVKYKLKSFLLTKNDDGGYYLNINNTSGGNIMNNVNKILLASLFLVVGTFFISCKVNSSSSEPTSSSSPTSSLNSSSDSSSLNSSSDSSISSTVEIEKETLNFTMDNLEVTYDGEVHSLEVNEELPEGVSVEYTNNDNTEIGTYDVHVKFIDTTGNYLVPEEFDDTYEIYNDNTYCQVTFIYDDGTQQIEFVKKGNVIVDVPSIEDKLGYESRWNYDFSNPIMNDENIT